MNQNLSKIERLCEIYNYPEEHFLPFMWLEQMGKDLFAPKSPLALQKEGYK